MARRAIRQGRQTVAEPPAHLDEAARAKWREIASTLDTTQPGVADALSAYCVSFSRWQAAEAQVGVLGVIIKSPAGFPVENPYLGVVKRALIEMHRWGKELRLVTHRAKTKADQGQDADQGDGSGLLKLLGGISTKAG